VIEEQHKKDIKDFRRKRLGEIYWIMKEAHEETDEEKMDYNYLIHNYLM